MRHAETQEKVALPAKEDIQTEKTHQSIFQGVTGFDKSQMRHAETEEKVALPAKEGIRVRPRGGISVARVEAVNWRAGSFTRPLERAVKTNLALFTCANSLATCTNETAYFESQ